MLVVAMELVFLIKSLLGLVETAEQRVLIALIVVLMIMLVVQQASTARAEFA
jgi:hypothetical protein